MHFIAGEMGSSADVLKSTRNLRGWVEDVSRMTREFENGTTLIIIADLPLLFLVFTFQAQGVEGIRMVMYVGFFAVGEQIKLVPVVVIIYVPATYQLIHDSGHDENFSSRPFGEFLIEPFEAFVFHAVMMMNINAVDLLN